MARGLALLGTVLVLVLFGGVGGASAHAALTGADPQDGSVLKTAPRQVTLTFTESIGLLDDSFRVLDPGNRRVHTGDPGHADGRSDTARVTLPKGLGTGTFTVAWRVVSADSHPVSGAFTFSIGKPSASVAPVPVDPAGDTVSATLYDIARYVAYGGLALLIGTAAFVLVCGFPGPVRRLLLAGWWTLFLSTFALLLLRGPYERGSGPADALDPSVLNDTLAYFYRASPCWPGWCCWRRWPSTRCARTAGSAPSSRSARCSPSPSPSPGPPPSTPPPVSRYPSRWPPPSCTCCPWRCGWAD